MEPGLPRLASRRSNGSISRDRSSSNFFTSSSDLDSVTESTVMNAAASRMGRQLSYVLERRASASPEVVRSYQRVQRRHLIALAGLTEEKAQIIEAIEREQAHTEAMRQEAHARRERIRETFDILTSNAPRLEKVHEPPSMSQLRRIANAILKEGLSFKEKSERSTHTIERETRGVESLHTTSLFELQGAPGPQASVEKVLSYQISRLSHLVLKKEDAKLRLETIIANRQMLHRMIHDRKDDVGALKTVRDQLQVQSAVLIDQYREVLSDSATALGEIAWKNAVVTACNDISGLARG
jgi:hypothetical protein